MHEWGGPCGTASGTLTGSAILLGVEGAGSVNSEGIYSPVWIPWRGSFEVEGKRRIIIIAAWGLGSGLLGGPRTD